MEPEHPWDDPEHDVLGDLAKMSARFREMGMAVRPLAESSQHLTGIVRTWRARVESERAAREDWGGVLWSVETEENGSDDPGA